MLVDSHCHLPMIDYAALNSSLDGVIQEAMLNGLEHMLCVGTRLEDVPEILKIANAYSMISASVGLHPNEATTLEPQVEELVSLASDPKVVAIGETGLDYFRSEGDLTWQQERFRTHIQAAKKLKKPLIIHTRQARQDTIQILQEEGAVDIGGVFHCFTSRAMRVKPIMPRLRRVSSV